MKSICILGPFSSGTNLLKNILETTNIPIVDPLWKHDINMDVLEDVIENNPTTLFIIMYRPLFTWIESMCKYPYDIEIPNTFLDEVKFKDTSYKNIIEIYVKYYTMYMKLIQKYPNVISMRYYQLIHPSFSYNYIKSKISPFLQIEITNEKLVECLSSPAKTHGHCVSNNLEAIRNFKNIKYNNKRCKLISYFFEK
jgi:hypothetical protein